MRYEYAIFMMDHLSLSTGSVLCVRGIALLLCCTIGVHVHLGILALTISAYHFNKQYFVC